jgi:hypothetical protein
VHFERQDGTQQVVLIEWKYCESYSSTPYTSPEAGRGGQTSTGACSTLLTARWIKTCSQAYDDLFYEPFYQFMRQQFLAHAMEKARELGADIVSLLHIAPAANRDFRRVTSPGLRALGESATQIWSRLVRPPGRFLSVSTEALFGGFAVRDFPPLTRWWDYVSTRYRWLVG